MSTVPSGQRWYCVQTKPRTEARALENLERQAFECLLPRIRRDPRAGQLVPPPARDRLGVGPRAPHRLAVGGHPLLHHQLQSSL